MGKHLNAANCVLSTVDAIPGLNLVSFLPNLALGSSELAIDLFISHLQEQAEGDQNYEASKKMSAFIGIASVLTGTTDRLRQELGDEKYAKVFQVTMAVICEAMCDVKKLKQLEELLCLCSVGDGHGLQARNRDPMIESPEVV